MTNYCSSH